MYQNPFTEEKNSQILSVEQKNFIIALKNDTLRHFFQRKMRAKMNRYGTFFNAF
jgi:hypothetical protein